jgi:deoxyadenosine/deoxycytidine kinase
VLSNEIDRINGILSNTERENSDLKMNIVGYNQLRIRYEEQLALMVIIFAEVESLRSRVKEKEREVEEVRRSSLAPYRR